MLLLSNLLQSRTGNLTRLPEMLYGRLPRQPQRPQVLDQTVDIETRLIPTHHTAVESFV